MEQTSTIKFVSALAADSEGSLQIKQEEWKENTGFVTKADLYTIMYNQLRNQSISGAMDCGFDSDTSISCKIYVYPNPASLNYQLYTSYGNMSSFYIDNFLQKERVDFSVSNKGSLSFATPQGITYRWEGVVRDKTGASIGYPSVSFDGDSVILDQAVYGTLFVQYYVVRHVYTLSATARVKDGEVSQDAFGAVIYGVYNGGISWTELQPPPYATELAAGGECGSISIELPEEEEDSYTPPKYAPTIEKVSTWDYCSGELLNYTETQVG